MGDEVIGNMIEDAGIPPSEEVLLAELHKEKQANFHLRRSLSNARKELKQTRRELNKLIKEKKKKRKQHYRNGRKRGSNGFNG